LAKKIITKQDIEDLYFKGCKELRLEKDTIILPGAKDAIRNAGIKLLYLHELNSNDINSNDINERIIGLSREFGIEEEETIKEISRRVMEKLPLEKK
jgi:ethanolamine utilization cobalamin adenosyltransferase